MKKGDIITTKAIVQASYYKPFGASWKLYKGEKSYRAIYRLEIEISGIFMGISTLRTGKIEKGNDEFGYSEKPLNIFIPNETIKIYIIQINLKTNRYTKPYRVLPEDIIIE